MGRKPRRGSSAIVGELAARAKSLEVRRHDGRHAVGRGDAEVRERPVLGPIAPARITDITRVVVREFFDQELLGRRSTLLAGAPQFPEVSVRTFAPPAR